MASMPRRRPAPSSSRCASATCWAQRQRRADLQEADRARRADHGHASRDAALLHDHPRGRPAGAAGSAHGQGRRNLRARHGRRREDRRPREQPDCLSGLRPGEDIEIEFVGVRPGEKLCEELSALGEDTRPTCHNKIKIFANPSGRPEEIAAQIEPHGTPVLHARPVESAPAVEGHGAAAPTPRGAVLRMLLASLPSPSDAAGPQGRTTDAAGFSAAGRECHERESRVSVAASYGRGRARAAARGVRLELDRAGRPRPRRLRARVRPTRSGVPARGRAVERHGRAPSRAARCSASARRRGPRPDADVRGHAPTRSSTPARRPVFVDSEPDDVEHRSRAARAGARRRARAAVACRGGASSSTSTASAPTTTRIARRPAPRTTCR